MITATKLNEEQITEYTRLIRYWFYPKNKKREYLRMPLDLLWYPNSKEVKSVNIYSLEGEERLKSFFSGLYSSSILHWKCETNWAVSSKIRETYPQERYFNWHFPSLQVAGIKLSSERPFNQDPDFQTMLQFHDTRFLGKRIEHAWFNFIEVLNLIFTESSEKPIKNSFPFSTVLLDGIKEKTIIIEGYYCLFDSKNRRAIFIYENEDDRFVRKWFNCRR